MGNRSAPTVEHQIVSITVQLGVTTPDNLRHVGFTLEKDTSDDGTVSWEIDFTLQERSVATDPFVDIVTLTVKVKTRNNAGAEVTATDGLSDAQANHLTGPASVAAKKLNDGTVSEDRASKVVEKTLTLHDA